MVACCYMTSLEPAYIQLDDAPWHSKLRGGAVARPPPGLLPEVGQALKALTAFAAPPPVRAYVAWSRQDWATIPEVFLPPAAQRYAPETPWSPAAVIKGPAGDECPQQEEDSPQQKNRKDKRRNVLLIATHLNELQKEDPTKIVIVRKVNRLGFNSADVLKKYFERFGRIAKVRLSNAHSKQPGVGVRVRPSGIAFLLFEDARDAARVLESGESHSIGCAQVLVRGFERRQGDHLSSADSDEISEGASHDTEDNSKHAAADVGRRHTW